MIEARMAEAAEQIDAALAETIAGKADMAVTHAMAHALKGGKRLRGVLVLEGARLHDVGPDRAVWAAAGIEAMHAYSLVHDDLPAMDDDDLRRGQPTIHRAWDEATAILAGDGLHSLAFELVSQPRVGGAEVRADLVASLAKAAGIDGMVLGQAQDIAAETAEAALSLAAITALQSNKTGALIRWSGEAGPRLAGADLSRMSAYADALGLAFQIADDLLDVEGNADATGKAVGKDAGMNKATFVSLLGVDGARARAEACVQTACDAVAPMGEGAAMLQALARFVIDRQS